MEEAQWREAIIVGNASLCATFTSCSTCVHAAGADDCAWCATDSTCIDASSRSGSCDSELFGSCNQSYYTIIFVTVLAVMFCICCATCYLRRLHRLQEQQMLDLFSPLLPQRAREMLFRNSLLGEGELEWMCIICGFDNKPRNKDCIMCGTSHQFSMDYKTEKKEQRRQKHQKWKLSMLARKNNNRNKQSQPPPNNNAESEASLEQNNNVDIPIPADAQITTISMSLRNFDAANNQQQQQSTAAAVLTHEQREEAINYRRLNNLTLRQKSARRRKMWQRERDPITGEFIWRRVPVKQIKVGSAPFGYTPRPSISGNVNNNNAYGNGGNEGQGQSSFLSFLSFRPPTNTASTHNAALEDLLSAARSPNDSTDNVSVLSYNTSPLRRIPSQRSRLDSKDSFGDSVLASHSPGFTSVFDEEGGLEWHRVDSGAPVAKSSYAATAARFPWSTSTATTAASASASALQAQQQQQQGQGQLGQLLNNVVGGDEEQGQATATAAASPLHLTNPSNSSSSSAQQEEQQPFITNTTTTNADQCPVDLAAVAAWTFKEKQLWFLDRMSELQKPWTDGFVRMEVRRNKILDDSHRAWSQLRPQDYHKWMRFQFANEPGIDAGGLEREWFSLVIDEIFSPAAGLFLQCGAAGSGVYHINPISGAINANHLSFFRFIGRLLGKALMEQQFIKANLSLPLRKQIIGTPVTFSDLEFVDEQLYRNLLWLNNANDEDVESMCLDFSISYTAANQTMTFDLKPNGTDIAVTSENREEYLMLRLRHRLLDSIKPQLEHLLSGLYEFIPPELLSVFDYQELDLLLCGVSGPELDLQDWIRHTEYMGEYRRLGARHPVIRWFWLCVESMSSEERVRLLQFTTGCARLPVMGFKALQSSDGRYRKFNIQSITKQDSVYPRAHTCFNKLDLPMYESKEEMEGFLSFVINISPTGFHME